MTPSILSAIPPEGYRFMLAHEAERMSHGHPIALLHSGMIYRGTVKSFGDATMTVALASGALVTLGLDDPDYWPDFEDRDRRPPMDETGEYVALQEVKATRDEDVEPLLRTGVALAKVAKNDPELQEAIKRLREIITDRLTVRAA